MEYMILLYVDAEIDARPGAPEWDASLPQHRAFAEAVRERGFKLSGRALHDATTATSVRVREGERLITDGPFAETKEQLWGYHMIEAPDIDSVIDLCTDLWEAEHGTVEIRPMIPSRAPAEA
ncbi:MAG: dehydrogenase [Solirubrobacterales bacterium]|jgi:hypothetical protein|nr:dehydrogenase [Solirubrobacterales bacterium]